MALAPHLFEILLSLSDGPAHGYAIIRDIEERTDGAIVLSTSTLYAGIRKLMRDGLIEEGSGEPESLGPPRRYYRLTARGRETAKAEALRCERQARWARKKFLTT